MARRRSQKTELAWELLESAVRDAANRRTPRNPIDLSLEKEQPRDEQPGNVERH